MKNFTLTLSLILLCSYNTIWAKHTPKHHYNNCEARYYYIPEIDTYYDMDSELFVYRDCDVWRRSYRLPKYLRRYNRNNIVIIHDYYGPRPYHYHRPQHRFNNSNKRHYRKRYQSHHHNLRKNNRRNKHHHYKKYNSHKNHINPNKKSNNHTPATHHPKQHHQGRR